MNNNSDWANCRTNNDVSARFVYNILNILQFFLKQINFVNGCAIIELPNVVVNEHLVIWKDVLTCCHHKSLFLPLPIQIRDRFVCNWDNKVRFVFFIWVILSFIYQYLVLFNSHLFGQILFLFIKALHWALLNLRFFINKFNFIFIVSLTLFLIIFSFLVVERIIGFIFLLHGNVWILAFNLGWYTIKSFVYFF